LPNNLLSDESAEPLLKTLSSNPVKSLDLTNNKVSDEVASALAEFLLTDNQQQQQQQQHTHQFSKCRLQRICLALNRLSDKGCKSLTAALESNRGLRFLDLSANELTQDACPHVANMLK